MIRTVLLVAAAVCFLLATFEVPVPRVNLTALGLFLVTLSVVLTK